MAIVCYPKNLQERSVFAGVYQFKRQAVQQKIHPLDLGILQEI
jgi:hypothetical protein